MSQKPGTKELRDAVKHIDGAWVRNFGNGRAWAGIQNGDRRERGMNEVREALEAAGYKTECIGKPGTEGAYIVDVIL